MTAGMSSMRSFASQAVGLPPGRGSVNRLKKPNDGKRRTWSCLRRRRAPWFWRWNHGPLRTSLGDTIWNGLLLEPLVVSGVFLFPKRLDEGVFDLPNDPQAVELVGEHPVHSKEGHVLAVKQCRNRIVEDVFHPRPPGLPPKALERAHNPGGHQMPFVFGHIRQEI